MGKGETLGRELRHWITVDQWQPAAGPALANRLIDLLGDDDSLKSPLRDLAAQPLFLQLLRQPRQPSRAAAEALCSLLARTYAPSVLAELEDLIAAATGLDLPPSRLGAALASGAAVASTSHLQPGPAPLTADRPGPSAPCSEPPAAADPAAAAPVVAPDRGALLPLHPGGPLLNGTWLLEQLSDLGPGLALAFSVSLVLAWAAAQLDRVLLDAWGWSGGVTLALVLLVLQIGSSGPLRRLRRHGLLHLASSDEPRLAWRWFSAPWLHARGGEALTNALLLLILLGRSPLPLNQVVLRFGLTALATQALAVLSARASGMVVRRWGGAAGPVAALIGLASCLSLLNWRELGFRLGLPGDLTVPAWVLLVVNASLQLAWQLPRTSSEDSSRPADRLWSSTWWWGTWLGVTWGLLTWLLHGASQLLKHGGGR